jgi:O-antigen/teichoic acid export membrane protein
LTVADTVGQAVRLILWQTLLIAVAAGAAWFLIPADWEALRYPLGIVLLAFVLTFPLRTFGAILHGLQDLAFLGRMGILSFLVSTTCTVTLVLSGWGLYALAVGWVVLQLTNAAAGWFRLHRCFPSVMPRHLPKMSWPIARKWLGQGSWVSLSQIAQVLLNGTDILIIGRLFGPAAVVPFVITGKLIGVLSNQPQMLMAAAGPALSQMRVAESRERLSEVCIALSQAMLLVSGAVVCVVLVVNRGFVGRWVGAEQYGGFWLTVLILSSMLLRHWNLTVGYALFCFGYERRICLTTLSDGLFSVIAVALLVRSLGLVGAPLGLIAGACLISLPANLSALARESGTSILKLMAPLAPWFGRFLVLLPVAGAVARYWTPTTLPLIAVTAVASALIYLAVMSPLAWRYPLGQYIRPRLLPLRARMIQVLRLRTSE